MTTEKASRVVQVLSGVGWARARTALGLGALLLWGLVTTASGQVTGQIVQQFFVPFPEGDFKTSLQAIAAGNPTGNGISNQIMTTISIVVGTSNTIIVYDHWEDGYENDLNNPTQPTTLIWGNGNTNTPAPGYPSNILPPGAVITLTNVVTLPRNPSVVQYDGRDRIGATRPVTVTRAGWATNIGTLMATATEVYDTSRYGTSFIIPVGTNTTPTIQNFSYSSLHIIAAQDNTVVKVDVNGDGIVDLTNTLNMGESMFVNGGVLCGATVTANNPVQVHELTGRISSDYQSRTFAIRPVSQWDTNYYAPVGTTTENYAHNVFVFNQFRTNLTVLYSTMATNGSFTVSNYTTYKFPMPLNSGARFYTTNGAAFYAVGCDDTGSSTPDDNQDYDWGYALLPAAALTPVAIVGWAPGSDFTSGAPANGSPVWVTPTRATTIYVNYSGNYNSGPLIAPNGNHYDTNFTLVAYQFQTIFNPTTKNMTGARIFTVDGTTFAAAWGEDPAVAGSGLPYMDAGTGIIPFPQPTMSKSSQLVVDVNGNGKPGWGDTMEYTIQVQNLGMLVLGNVLVLDALPNTVTYVTNSTTLNGVPVADNLVPPAATAFPLDESGLVLPEIQVDGYSTLTYRVVINSGATSISNAVLGSAGDQPVTSTESFLVAGPVTLAFTDASGNPVSSYVTNSGVYISLIDLIQNTNANTAQTVTVTVSNVTGGDVESLVLTETGTNTGIFRNTTPLPMSTTAGTNKNDGTLHALAGNFLLVSYTDPISGNSGSATVTVTASPLPYVTKSSLLVVDLNGNGLIGWGDTVQYSILLTNTTAQAITNLVVLDTLPANVSYVTNSTASNGVAVADSGTTPFPLDESGLSVRSLAASNSTLLTFRVTVNSGTSISNSVTVTNLNGLVQAQNVASVTPPPPSCNLNFTDGSGNPVTTCVQNAGLYVTMTDSSQNTSPTNAQTVTVTITNVSGGDVESLTLTETGTNTGVFRNTTALPTSTIFGTAQQDGTLNGSAGQVVTVYFAGAGGETCSASATFVPAVQTKKLYLSAVTASNLYQNLNRINPVAAGATSTSNSVALTNGSSATFVQTPVFCQPFVLSADSPVAVTNYVSILSGSMPASPAIRAIIMQGTNAATATNILTLTNAAYSGGLLGWSGTLSSNVTVGAGETTFLVITSAQSGASFSIQYNSASKPSAISLPTTTVISLEQLGVYDAPYPGGNLVTNALNAQTVYIRATASDPFGAYDVTKISLYLLDPGGYAFTTNLTGAYLVASNACSSTYEYPWVTENWQGYYSVLATAYEGTEGITNALQTFFQAHYPSGGTPSTTTFIDSSGNPTNSYATNQTVCVQVQNPDANQNPAAVETVSVVITTTSGDRETVTLTETGTNTGVFTGCITANTGAAVPGNGVLNAPGGSGLIATYTDALFPSNTSSNSAIVRLPPGPQPVVSLFKTLVAPANSTVLLGSTVQFNLEVANPGSVTVTNVTLTDTFPSNRLQFVSATIPANSSTPAGTLTWTNLGPLTPGTNLIISAFFTAKMAGELTNSASVTGTTNVGPVTAMATNNVSAIAVTKTLVSPIPGPAYINSNVVFQIAIANTGVKAITSYQLQDLFSSACFQFLGASVPPSGSGGGVVLWSSMPALAVGASTNIYVTNKVIGDCEPAVNNANISSVVDQSGDSVPNAQSSASITNLGASISGLVWYDANANGTNDAGDSPLASVNVYVDLNGDGVRQGNEPYATTDTNGLYEIVSIPAGSYAVRVDTNSLPAGVRPTYDLDGTNTPNTVSLIISNGQVFPNLNFGYVGSGSISGYIWNDLNGDGVLEAGEPGLSGVTVFIDLNANGVRDAGEPYIASAPDGSFAFDYLVANTYRVAADILSLPPNMRPTFDLDGTNTPNVATITLGAGQNITNANFGYQGRASLTGLITDTSTGFPVTGATVVVVDSQGNTQTVITSASGTYSVLSLWTGPAIVTVGKTGYGSAGANPTIAGGANTQNLSLTPNTLAGVVTNTLSGQAIAGATVQVVDSANVTNTIATDSNGHYGVTNIAAGVATITASQSGYVAASASPTILAGANRQDLGLTPNSLTGLVTDAVTTLPIVGASVAVTDSSNAVHTVTTDATGHYSVTVLPTGPSTVTASQIGYGSAGANPTIIAGANIQNLSLIANTLVGVITNTATGLPIAGATVQVVDSANVTNTIATDSNGHYGVTNIAAGVATLTASQSGYVATSAGPTILAGANRQDLGLTPNSLTGLVTDAVTMLPIVGATVAVTDSSNAVHTVTTDATGHYSVTVLPTGPASVTASQIGYGSAGANPTITAGANIQNLSLIANTLVGVITNTATGLPISGATVQVVDSANVTNTIATDASGHYGVTNIAGGIATITASQSGYVAASASPTIVTGANAQDLGLTPNSLTGLVTDAVTTLPIVGASVAVTDSSNAVHTVTTDATGHYSVTVLPTGPSTVTVSQIGYGSAGANPTIIAGANIQNLSLIANTLVGVITNTATGLPIAGATVQVVDSANVTNTIATDSNGHYGVTNIAAGVATLTASQSGYVATSAGPTILAGANRQDLGLTPNSLTGLVTDAVTMLPIVGATVAVTDSSNAVHTVTTDATGHYSVTVLPTGPASVTASQIGYGSAGANPTITAGANIQNLSLIANTLVGVITNTATGLPISGATVQVVDSANVTNTIATDASGHYGVTNIAGGIATITASQSGYVTASASPTILAGANTQNLGLTPNSLTGLVTDAVTMLPIVGATVAVTDSSNAVHTVTTDATGHYSVTVLPTGPASVTASQIGYGSAGANPTITAGANIQNLSLIANTLVGVITNAATGLPIAGATVQVVDSANVTNTIATDSNGHYGVTNIAAGITTITASQSGYVTASAGPTIVAGANKQDLGLTPNSLTGLVTDAVTMLPIAGASVSVTDSSNAVHTVTTDATGHYSVTVLPTGPASVTASQIGYGSAGANPTIVAGANTQNLSLAANTLTGIITDSLSGLPIAGANVAVIDSAGVNTSFVTGPSGAYSVSGIAVGAASVTANMVGYSSANASPVISAGANTQDLKLTPNILTGHVTDAASQQPLAGVLVQVIDGAGTTNTITTDATGYYGVTNIAPGVATVTASKSGYNTATATPTIVAGPNTQDLQLSVSNPTLALLSSIKAYLAGDGVLVRWQTASEAGSVTFDLYRKAPAGDNWVKVNAAPVLAANSPTGSTYEVADPDAKPAETLAYRLVELEEQGTTRTYGPFGLHADAPTPAAPLKALVTGTASPLAKAALVRSPQPLTQTASAPLSTLDGSRFIKIITTNGGIQNVTATALGIALGQAPANIQSAILARSLLLSNRGQPVAYVASADGSALSFYAEPLKNNYTAQNVYSLTFAPGLPLGTVLSPPTTPVPATKLAYLAELDLEQDLLAVPSLVQDPSQDFWMWQRLVAGIPMFNTAAFSFALDHLSVSGSGTASLTLHLLGGDQATHTVQVTLNGSLVGQDTWQGCTPHDTVLQIPNSLLIEGANQLSLQAVATAGSATSQWYVNSFGLNYPRQYFAVNGTLLFNANSNMVITVDGFTSPAITVLEISDPNQPALVQNLTIAPTDAGYSASFAPADPQNQFVAFQSGAGTTPASVACAQTANLSRAANAADYIIIAPDNLTAPAGQLAAYRRQKGLRPVVVSLDRVYDEFSSGIITPEAIRQFLRTALTNWVVKPRYVVLIGNGTYDYRDLLQQHDNLMPPLLVNTSYGLFCSDSAYGDLNGDGQPEIAVGRLPVKTAQQLLALIGKIQTYEALPQTAPAQALLVADAPDSAGDFTAAIQQVSTTLVGSYSNTVVQGAGQSNLGLVRQAIQSSLNAGVDLVDYIGHGAIDRFGNYGYLTSADVATLQNGARLPVVVAVTCVAGQYSVPGSVCLAEYLSLQNAVGAIAVVAPTGLSVDQDASRLNLRLLNLLRANAGPGVGDMFRQALADHVALDNPTTQPAIYNLIGDPALAYNVAMQTSAAAPQFTGASVTNGGLVITWSGGQPPYQLEQTTTLGPKASWQAVGSPVSGFTTTLPVTGPMGLIRVRCSR